jgi:ABC-type amino acid transport substrate-binding protein
MKIRKLAWMTAFCIGTVFFLSGCGMEQSPSKISAPASGEQTYIIGTAGTVPKWSETSDKGGVQGFDIDVFQEIAKRNQWKIEWRVAEPQALWGMLDNDQILTIASDTTKNAQREQKYNFSDNYAYGGYLFMTKLDYPAQDDGILSFKNKKIAVEANTNMRLALEQQAADKDIPLEYLYLDNQAAALMAVVNGQADAAYVSRSAGYIAIQSLKMNLAAHDAKYRHNPICYAFKKTPASDQAREKVNAALNSMRQDGTLKSLSEKWFGTDFTYLPDES